MDVKKELDTIKDLVKYVLKNNIDTRDNDTKLYLECCKLLGCNTLDDVYRLNLSIVSVHKIRQVIQNKEKLYEPSPSIKKIRKSRRTKIRDYMVN